MRDKRPNSNEPVAEILREIADYFELEEENIHKVAAYRRAASIVKMLPYDITTMENLTAIKGIGDSIAATIGEILNTGTCALVRGMRLRHKGRKKDGEASGSNTC